MLKKNSKRSQHTTVGGALKCHFQPASLSPRCHICCFDRARASSPSFPICLWSWKICHLGNLVKNLFPRCSWIFLCFEVGLRSVLHYKYNLNGGVNGWTFIFESLCAWFCSSATFLEVLVKSVLLSLWDSSWCLMFSLWFLYASFSYV